MWSPMNPWLTVLAAVADAGKAVAVAITNSVVSLRIIGFYRI